MLSEVTARVSNAHARALQVSVQAFVRSFGLLVTKQTPCGQPLTPSHAHALLVLLEREERGITTRQSELANRLGLDKSSIARLCERLEADAHAAQHPAPDDGRSRLLELTPRGRRMASTIQAASLARFRRVAEGVPPTKRQALLESLRLLTAAVQALGAAEP
ncbi:MAG TPA: MarR family winged helix-turn-helix transcriptional regulator [Polyangiaceae bacterium]|nr:MarR family winged helix-turn-helix transcriptional regulator [Polyangiaceae bacterium]